MLMLLTLRSLWDENSSRKKRKTNACYLITSLRKWRWRGGNRQEDSSGWECRTSSPAFRCWQGLRLVRLGRRSTGFGVIRPQSELLAKLIQCWPGIIISSLQDSVSSFPGDERRFCSDHHEASESCPPHRHLTSTCPPVSPFSSLFFKSWDGARGGSGLSMC